MLVLILGLVIFLGTHSIRLVAGDWRAAQIATLGEPRWKGIYALASVIGFALIVWGYGLARADTASLWFPPLGIRHLTGLLTAIAFVLLVAAYVPGTRIKALVGHPMLAGVMVWAGAHLLANGTLHAELLFAAFFVWAFVDFIASRARPARRRALSGRLACARRRRDCRGSSRVGAVRVRAARMADRRAAVRVTARAAAGRAMRSPFGRGADDDAPLDLQPAKSPNRENGKPRERQKPNRSIGYFVNQSTVKQEARNGAGPDGQLWSIRNQPIESFACGNRTIDNDARSELWVIEGYAAATGERSRMTRRQVSRCRRSPRCRRACCPLISRPHRRGRC
ncbi:NnrU protein [Burkholderia pseudomallei]|nr:NnrU protein [Burkholderia pseudomallei]